MANAGARKYYDAADATQLKVAASEMKERVAPLAPAPRPTPGSPYVPWTGMFGTVDACTFSKEMFGASATIIDTIACRP